MEIDDNGNSNSNSNVNYSVCESSLRVLNDKTDIRHPYTLDSNSNNNNSKSYNINMNEVDALLQYGLHNCMRIGIINTSSSLTL